MTRPIQAPTAFQSTPSVWRATTRLTRPIQAPTAFQSTPSVWRATAVHCFQRPLFSISIHALRVEGDIHTDRKPRASKNFNPRPPCGGRHSVRFTNFARIANISIHALRVEGDFTVISVCGLLSHFNPRPPCGGRRCSFRYCSSCKNDFNPRPPCGGRPYYKSRQR